MGSIQPSIRRVAVIGAGPTGLACAKYLLAEKAFERVDVYEQRQNVGGVWNHTPCHVSQHVKIPQTSPNYGIRIERDEITRQNNIKHYEVEHFTSTTTEKDDLELETPMYDYLETNIPKNMMAYSDFPFDESLPLYPGYADVLRYLERYAEDISEHIRFGVKVVDAKLDGGDRVQDVWQLKIKNLDSGEVEEVLYDAVVAANGHYTVPRVPDVQGLKQWSERWPGAVIHSKAYRKPETFEGKKVLVIGNSASGLDIGGQIAQYSAKPLIMSSRSASQLAPDSIPDWRRDVGEVEEFLDPTEYDRGVRTKEGVVLEGIDAVVFATGYFYNFPFLSGLEKPLVTDGYRTKDVYQHFLHIDHPSLAVPVLNLKIVPFPLAENQAAVIARLWSGRLSTPSREEMRAWERQIVVQRGDGKDFHLKRFPEDAAQLNDLYAWAASAQSCEGLDNNGKGKLGPTWDQSQVWLRGQFPNLRAAYVTKGDDRTSYRTPESLDFVFDDKQKTSQRNLQTFEKAHIR